MQLLFIHAIQRIAQSFLLFKINLLLFIYET